MLAGTHNYARANVRQLTDAPSAHATKLCGHAGHVGTCPACQRAAAMRAAEMLEAATAARLAWLAERTVDEVA
jgi:hypothetical protein